jgi:hypothetical protein
MSIVWDNYEFYDPGFPGVLTTNFGLDQVPRVEARRVYKRCMATKPERLVMLERLLAANGVVLGRTDEAVQELNDWFVASVEPDPEPPPGQIDWPWLSVCHDVALFLGEVMIERHPNLRWEFFTWGGKRSVSYHRNVIMGFNSEDSGPLSNLVLYRTVKSYAVRIIESKGSIPVCGVVEVRGVKIDVDEILSFFRAEGVETDRFLFLLRSVAERNKPNIEEGQLR